jgi:uncharacterized protein (DUF1684 family)
MTEALQQIATGPVIEPAAEPATAGPEHALEYARWHADRERELATPHGWLSLTALLWPTAEPRRLPGLPGEWWVADRTLYTRPAPDDTTALTGDLVVPHGQTQIAVDEGRSRILGTFLPEGRAGSGPDGEQEVAVEVVLRTGRYAIRARDPLSATRSEFDGVPVFEHDASWVLDADVSWYDEPERVTVGAAQPRLVHHVDVIGTVDVVRGGTVTKLALTGTLAEPTLLFTDESDEVAPWRVLRIAAPDPEQTGLGQADREPGTSGTLRLDLNRTVNLPYAFTQFGTCPAPLAGNHLPFAVTAGEKAPR